jgi:hypothetical protein
MAARSGRPETKGNWLFSLPDATTVLLLLLLLMLLLLLLLRPTPAPTRVA